MLKGKESKRRRQIVEAEHGFKVVAATLVLQSGEHGLAPDCNVEV